MLSFNEHLFSDCLIRFVKTRHESLALLILPHTIQYKGNCWRPQIRHWFTFYELFCYLRHKNVYCLTSKTISVRRKNMEGVYYTAQLDGNFISMYSSVFCLCYFNVLKQKEINIMEFHVIIGKFNGLVASRYCQSSLYYHKPIILCLYAVLHWRETDTKFRTASIYSDTFSSPRWNASQHILLWKFSPALTCVSSIKLIYEKPLKL